MPRLDQSQWELIVDRNFQKKEYNEEIPVHLNFPCDKAIITLNLLIAKPSWVNGGGVSQRWQRLLVPIEVAYSSLALSFPKVVSLEPVENSILWFWTHHWITEIHIVVEARRFNE
jgi:hypothetical protein